MLNCTFVVGDAVTSTISVFPLHLRLHYLWLTLHTHLHYFQHLYNGFPSYLRLHYHGFPFINIYITLNA